jgi:hypothetical protein
MGLRTVPEAAWLDVDERRDEELALKRALLAERRDEVFAALPDTEPAGQEVLHLVVLDLQRRGLNGSVDSDRHPLEAASLLVQEDLCLMADRDGESCLVAASLCFPSHWRLSEKIGRPAAAIHEPVPHYARELEPKVDRFLARIPAGRISVRRNWSVNDHDTLFAPEHPAPVAGIDAADAGERLWIRSERQTLRRLPESGAVLFTIRVQHALLGVLADRPDRAAAMASALRATAAGGHSRVNGPHLEAALGWLDRISGPTGSG